MLSNKVLGTLDLDDAYHIELAVSFIICAFWYAIHKNALDMLYDAHRTIARAGCFGVAWLEVGRIAKNEQAGDSSIGIME